MCSALEVTMQMTYRVSEIPIKIPMAFSTEIEENIPKICKEPLTTLNSQNNFEKESYFLISNYTTRLY